MPIFCVTRRQPPDANPKICVSPDANPRRQSVKYRWCWASGVGAGVGHVHFMFFVSISFAFCSQRKPSFRWNMGLNLKTGSKRREKISSRPHLKEIPVSISLYRDCLGYEQLSLFAAPSIVSWGAVQLSTEV